MQILKVILLLIFFFSFYNILLILSLMLRPASLALLLTIYLYFILINYKKLTYKINIVLITASLLFILYYLPYFLGELNRDKVQYPYYFNNIFIFHTEIVQNEIIRIFVIFFMKFLFLFGFDPTESGYPIIQIIRSFIGTIFIIGFFKTFYYKKIKLEFIYIWSTIFFIVIFFYPTYRYIVPVMPLLYLLFFMRLNKIY